MVSAEDYNGGNGNDRRSGGQGANGERQKLSSGNGNDRRSGGQGANGERRSFGGRK